MSEEILNEINEQVIENSEMLAEWFTQNLMPAIKSLKINPEKMFESKENIKASAESIFRILISNRYLTLAESGNFEKEDLEYKKNLLMENVNYDFGVVGFLLDINNVEGDYLKLNLSTNEAKLNLLTSNIINYLLQKNCPEVLIFGEFQYDNKTFEKEVENNIDSAINMLVASYKSSFLKNYS